MIKSVIAEVNEFTNSERDQKLEHHNDKSHLCDSSFEDDKSHLTNKSNSKTGDIKYLNTPRPAGQRFTFGRQNTHV